MARTALINQSSASAASQGEPFPPRGKSGWRRWNLLRQGVYALHWGRLEESYRLLRSLVEQSSPEDWTALSGCRYWVEACFRTGRYEEAVQACRHFSTRRFSAASERELSSTVGLVYILSGLAWIRLGEGLKAEEDLCYAVQYPLPLRSQSLLTVGHALLWLRRRDFGTAQRLLNEGLEKLQRVYSPRGRLLPLLRPRAEWQYSFILTVRGEVWAAQEVYSRAQGALEEALEYWPWNPEALLRLGEVFAAQNRLANARQAWQQVVHLGEEGPHAQTAQERLKSR